MYDSGHYLASHYASGHFGVDSVPEATLAGGFSPQKKQYNEDEELLLFAHVIIDLINREY